MPKKPPYQCPSCGYETDRKDAIRKHFNLKTHCCKLLNDLTLTDSIKEYVLANRIWRAPKEPSAKSLKISNQFNTQVNIMVKDMDTVQKLAMAFQNHTIINSDDKILVNNNDHISRFNEDDPKRGLLLSELDIGNVIRDFCSTKHDDMTDLVIMYDPPRKSVFLKKDKFTEWETVDMRTGIIFAMETLHGNYLSEYERYLLRCHKLTTHLKEKQDLIEHLQSYYRMIASFNLQPYCFEKSDDDIYDNGKYDRHECEDEFYPKYRKIKDAITQGEKNEWFKKVQTIIKENSRLSMFKLNKAVIKIVQAEDKTITCPSP